MLLLFIAGLFVSNNILKREYGNADKATSTGTMVKYWNSFLVI